MARSPARRSGVNVAGPAPPLAPRAAPDGRIRLWVVGAMIVAGTLCAYHNTFGVPLLLDDRLAIVSNPSIEKLGALSKVLWAPSDLPTAGRPLLNLSFALNRAISGREVFSYHVLNLLIHCLAALTLFGLVRRTLLSRACNVTFHRAALPLAAAIAAIWACHPLQTAAVTYLSQRAESLMGLLYLGTLYAFARAVLAARPGPWLLVATLACWAGMATKEVMVTAPLVVFLYDRAFFSSSFGAALRARRGFYAGLALSWIFLGVLMLASHLGARSVGFDQGVSPFAYALGETRVIVEYLKLAAWPVPLVFDYGFDVLRVPVARLVPCAIGVFLALASSLVIWRRSPPWGFLAGVFFVLLSPTSSFVPVAMQPMAESRMYLPLAPLVAGGLCVACAAAGRRTLLAALAVAIGSLVLTMRRNSDYRSELRIWQDTVAKIPSSARAQNSLGTVVATIPGRAAEAMGRYEESIRLRPDYGEAHYNLATELAKYPERTDEAIRRYERLFEVQPEHAKGHNGLANLLVRIPGRLEEGVRHYETALRLRPDYAEAHYNFGTVLADVPGGAPLAIEHYRVALQLKPDYAEAHNNLANELARIPAQRTEATTHYEEALRLRPDFPEAHNNFATLLAGIPGRLPDAMGHLESAIRLKPDFIAAHYNLAQRLEATPGRLPDAIARYETILGLNPNHAETHNALAGALYKAGRLEEAIAHLETALRLAPDYEDARENLKALRALRK